MTEGDLDTKPDVCFDMTHKEIMETAFYVIGTPVFQTIPVITHITDFSQSNVFCTYMYNALLVEKERSASYLKSFSDTELEIIVRICEILTTESAYGLLKINKLCGIIIRSDTGRGVFINNSCSNTQETMYFDIGTILTKSISTN